MSKSNTAQAVESASDLRQRAARARDAAGRFIRRATAGDAFATAAAAQDPALAVTAVFGATWEALGKALDAEVPDDLIEELQAAEGAAYDRLRVVRPTTPAGYRALAEAWSTVLEGERGGEPGVTHADHAADSLIAGAGACVPARLPAGSDENVLALIEEHRAFFAEWDRLSGVWNEMVPDDPGYAEAMAASDLPGRREVTAYEALFSAQPETLAGAAALASYLGEAVRRTRIDAQPSDGERALGTIARALRALAPVSASRSHPDAALLALGAEFVVAWTVEEEAPDGAGYWACNHLAQQIVQAPAVTVAGLGIKALLLARLDEDDSSPRNPAKAQGPIASHWNVLRQVQEGAARLATSPDMGMPMTLAAGPETGFPAAGSDAGDRLPAPRHDLSALSIAELARLHSAIAHAEEALGSAENRPCFSGDSRFGLTPAGWIINREAARLSQFSCAIAQEAGRREPADEDEREERLNTLISHAILAGGLSEHPEVLSEICTTWGSAR